METKEYIVALHDGVDYDQFWLDIESPTNGLPHIPDRPVGITNNRTAFTRLCEYALTDSEADRVKNDPRVASVEIPVRNNPMVTVAQSTIQTGNFEKTIYPGGVEINWGLIRHSRTTNVYGTGTSTTENYNYIFDGAGVDVVINDTGLQADHPEFAGRVEIVNWNSYYSGYTDSQTDTDGHGTHVAGIAAGTTYGWAKGAKVIPLSYGDISGVSSAEPLDFFEALINWHNAKTNGRPTVVNMSWELRIPWEYFQQYYGFSDYRRYITGGQHATGTILPGQSDSYYKSKGLLDLQQGLPVQDPSDPLLPISGGYPYTSTAYNSALAEVIDAGIIVVKAAGNNSFKMDKPTANGGSGDYDNYFTINVPGYPPSYFSGNHYYHRGSSPQDPRAIVVGSLDRLGYSSTLDQQAYYSTKGPRVDIYAAGTNIMSSFSNSYSEDPEANTRSAPYRHGDTAYKQNNLTGTSMAAPQITGMIALWLQQNPLLNIKSPTNNETAKSWLTGNALTDQIYSPTASLTDYTNTRALLGAPNRIAYQNLQSRGKIKTSGNTWSYATSVRVKTDATTWSNVQAIWTKTISGWRQTY
jgi:subtilisin family serine protease